MPAGAIDRELIYLDHAATTPMRPEAVAAMQPFLADVYANPSGSHRFAREARRAVDEARDAVAGVLGCKPGEVIFNGGGTEGDNSAVLGAVRRLEAKGAAARAVCSAAEHHAVLNCVEHVHGSIIATDSYGCIDAEQLGVELTRLAAAGVVPVVSTMAVNNEVGSVTSLDDVSRIVRRTAPNALLHTDAVQAACWLDLAPITKAVDLLTLSSHKFGGPKGCGVMFQREGVDIEPLIFGGGQERDRRSGTHNVAGIVATAAALLATAAERTTEVERVGRLRAEIVAGLAAIGGVTATIPAAESVAGIVHVCVEGVENEALLYLLDEAGLCASAASACASGAMEPSHVLAAMGVPRDLARGALRLSLGHTTTHDDVTAAIDIIGTAVGRLRAHARA
ncbi:MAG: cysteine desulfurase [Actinobacteria bacterium]|jgi:cysteine desulfurase|nr:cysteine desulfurase [Actinomycetota bacterium]NBP53420.1 cysteine desulfurase [Actinomycetota bacterium]